MAEQVSGMPVGKTPPAGSDSGSGEPFVIDRLGWRAALAEVLMAVLTSLGLTALWMLENLRNAFFNLLDRLNLKPRPRKGSAFPPGQPRKRKNHGS